MRNRFFLPERVTQKGRHHDNPHAAIVSFGLVGGSMGWGIDIGVGGRFHADTLARTLLHHGHEVRLWTSYPASRFPSLPGATVHSLLLPEVIYRLGRGMGLENPADLVKIRLFGKMLSRGVSKRPLDAFLGWSSFSLETLKLGAHRHRAVIRDSAHIRTQQGILEREHRKFGLPFSDRSSVIEREEAEYDAADTIFVLSDFAKRSFLERGVPESKLRLLRLGVDTSLFRPIDKDAIRLPLKVVYFGAVTLRKGVYYLLEACRAFSPRELELTIIGPVDPALAGRKSDYPNVRWLPAMPHSRLAQLLPAQDVFVLPTLEDGFGQTLIQAMACGLVPIVTDRCGAAERVVPGETGVRVPAGSAVAIRNLLARWIADPVTVSEYRNRLLQNRQSFGWSEYESDLARWAEHCARGTA